MLPFNLYFMSPPDIVLDKIDSISTITVTVDQPQENSKSEDDIDINMVTTELKKMSTQPIDLKANFMQKSKFANQVKKSKAKRHDILNCYH